MVICVKLAGNAGFELKLLQCFQSIMHDMIMFTEYMMSF